MAKAVKAAIIVAAVATGVGMLVAPGLIAGAGAIAGLAAGTAGAYFATTFVSTLVLGAVSKAMAKTPTGASITQQDKTVTSRQPIAPHNVIYGRTRIGGTILYMESTNANKYLHVVVAIAGHEIDEVEKFYFNDVEVGIDGSGNVNAGQYKDKARIKYKLGTDDQTAFADLVAESDSKWTNNHRVRGRALVYMRLEYDQNVFINGVPNLSVVVRGKKVYDPRTETTVWSANPALCVTDYLTNNKYGMAAVYAEEIDEEALIAAANICDEDVTKVGGGTENRYEMHGSFATSSQPEDIINQMVFAMAGRCVWSGGVWRILAGAYYTPTLTFDEGDLRGGIKVQSLVSRRESFNGVKGVFASVDDNYILSDFPPITSAAFVAKDNGEENLKSIELPFTTSASMAQRLAKIELLRARQQITVAMPMKLVGMKANVGDIVQINNTRMGWSSKPFEVVSANIAFGETVGVDIDLREVSTDVYDWSTSEEQTYDPAPNTNLPSGFVSEPVGISITDTLAISAETIITQLVVTVTGSDVFEDRFEVQAKPSTSDDFLNLGQASGNIFQLANVIDGAIYNVRARAINVFGVRSDWTTDDHEVIGKTAPPENVTGLTGNLIGNQYLLTWNAVPDLDLSYYRVRYASPDSGGSYENSVSLVPKVSRPATSVFVPARNGTYFVKAVDKLSLASITPASIALDTNIAAVESLNVIQTINEAPDFNGTFDDTVELDEDDALVLNTSVLFDAASGDFDDASGLFDGGSGNVDAFGYYYFATDVDLGAIYISRCTAYVKHIRLDYVVLFDSAEGLFDDRQGDFEGDVNAFDDTDVQIEARHTQDNPSGTPTWSAWQSFAVTDIRARAIQFRAKLSTTDEQATPKVTQLSVNVDMPDRTVSGNDIVSGAGAKVVTFAQGFRETPAIGIGAQDMQTGDYYEITSKSRTGFTITFKNSSGTAISRSFDYVAKGYGVELS
jgi:hypothetical protein